MNLPELRYYTHDSIDKVRWDRSLMSSHNGLVYASTWYLDAVTNESWDALISDDYQWIMPLPLKRKAGILYLPTPLFVQQLGIFGPTALSPEMVKHFLRQVFANVRFVEYQMNSENPIPEMPGVSVRVRNNYILPLPEDRKRVEEGFSENLTRNLKKAQRAAITLSTCSIRTMISLFIENRGNQVSWTEQHTRTLELLYNMCMMRGHGVTIGAYNAAGEVIAGAFITQWKDRATFIFSGNSCEGKELGALPAIIAKYLREAPPSIKLFDFEGSDDPGLARFYAGFGALNINYVHLKQNRLPIFLRWLKP